MGGSSIDGSGGKRQKRKGKMHQSGGGRSKKIKSRHFTKTPSVVEDSETNSKGNSSADENEKEYIVENILKKRMENGVWMYYIKWLGWSSETNTWEPKENLTGCPELLERFEEDWAASHGEQRSSTETVVLNKSSAEKSSTDKEKTHKKKSDTSQAIVKAKSDIPVKKTIQVEKPTDPDDSNYDDLDIVEEIPEDKVPHKIIGVVPISDVLVYCIEWKSSKEPLSSKSEYKEPIALVRGSTFRQHYPEMIIKFYEEHIVWAKDGKTEAQFYAEANIIHKTTMSSENSVSKDKKSVNGRKGSSDEDSDSDDSKPLAKIRARKSPDSDDSSDDDNRSKENYPSKK